MLGTMLEKIKDFVVYDADREFYAKIFPDSVGRKDLMRLRKMRSSDLPGVMAIERASYQFPWEEDIFRDCFKANYSCWVCVEDDDVLGYSILAMAVGEAHVLNICVAPAEQGQGIGRKMLENLIEAGQGTGGYHVSGSQAVQYRRYRPLPGHGVQRNRYQKRLLPVGKRPRRRPDAGVADFLVGAIPCGCPFVNCTDKRAGTSPAPTMQIISNYR